jgi:hypothetical protein
MVLTDSIPSLRYIVRLGFCLLVQLSVPAYLLGLPTIPTVNSNLQ